MIDASAPAASWFLLVMGAFFFFLYAVPLFFFPLRWARWFLWSAPSDTRLTVYFGRCLGALALTMTWLVVRAASAPRSYPIVFELLLGSGVLLTVVHVIGAVERSQPWTETAEIALYGLSTLATAYVYFKVL